MLRKDLKKSFAPSADPAEIARFNATAQEWRNPSGKFKVVHAFNTARLGWLFPTLSSLIGQPSRVLDVGCATGLVAEAFARQGATVTGIDVSERNLAIATTCAQTAGLPITYQLATPEEVAASPRRFPLVMALEVVEHVADLPSFLNGVFGSTEPDATVVIATLNRTWLSWLLGIVAAEYILRWLPRGTHTWARFVRPDELDTAASRHGFQRAAYTGFTFNPLRREWTPTSSLAVNYMLVYRRKA